MITNVRSRGLHSPTITIHDPGHILVHNVDLGIYEPKHPSPSTCEFNAADFGLQDQINLGMNLKPTHISTSPLHSVNQLTGLLRDVAASEFELAETEAIENNTYVESSTPDANE